MILTVVLNSFIVSALPRFFDGKGLSGNDSLETKTEKSNMFNSLKKKKKKCKGSDAWHGLKGRVERVGAKFIILRSQGELHH